MDNTDTATASGQTEATGVDALDIDNALESIFSTPESEDNEESQPTQDDEPDEPQTVEDEEPESQLEEEEVTEDSEIDEDEQPTGVDKRISQLVAQKNKFKDKVQELEGKLDDYEQRFEALENRDSKPNEPAVNPWNNSLSDITDVNQLKQKVDSAYQMKDWAIRNLDGGEVPGNDGETQFIDADQVRTALANAEQVLRDAPRQHEVINIRQHALSEAHASYPWLKDKSSENYQVLQQEMKIWGDFRVRDLPNLELVFANAIVGELARKKPQDAGKKAAQEKAPPVPTTTAQPRKGTKRTKSKAKQKFMETGDDRALDELLDEYIT